MSLRTRSGAMLGALSLAFVVAACGAAATPVPQEDAEAASCAAIQTFSDELRSLYSLDPTSASIEDYQAQRDIVAESWDAVKQSLEGVEAADQAAIDAGTATIDTAIDNFPSDEPVADAVESVKTASGPIQDAFLEMADGLGCAIATPF